MISIQWITSHQHFTVFECYICTFSIMMTQRPFNTNVDKKCTRTYVKCIVYISPTFTQPWQSPIFSVFTLKHFREWVVHAGRCVSCKCMSRPVCGYMVSLGFEKYLSSYPAGNTVKCSNYAVLSCCTYIHIDMLTWKIRQHHCSCI